MTPADLQELISSALNHLEAVGNEITLERPTNPEMGDFATTVALQSFKRLSPELKSHYQNPRGWADFLVAEIKKFVITSTFKTEIADISVAGPGFINFSLAHHSLAEHLKTSHSLITPANQDQTVIVEFSSPNIAKPFTIGHLRSTIIGDAIANILQATGAKVYRDNHLGDWGTQFGKQIYALMNLGEGSLAKNIAKISDSEFPVKELVQLYVEFHAQAEENPSLEEEGRKWFKKLEDGDPEARKLWQLCIDWSLSEFKRIYHQLGITFTENPDNGYLGYGESFFEDKMVDVITQLRHKKLLQTGKNGAELVFFPNDELPPLMVLKQDGATLYATRDLATDWFRRQKYGQDVTIINEVGAEQALYFKQLYRTEELLGWFAQEQRVHVKHGLYRFKDKKMSTRKGNVIWLEEVLAQASQKALEVSDNQTTAQQVGIGALKWNDLKRSSHLDVIFDWDEILNLKGNSGPYVQYTAVRAQSILTKAGKAAADLPDQIQFNEAEKAVVQLLPQFKEVVQKAAQEYAPHHICTYLYELAQAFNSFYNQHSVLGEEVSDDQKQVRLALTTKVLQTLTQGLELLGIEVPEKM